MALSGTTFSATDTNTTYSAGTGITLSGTTFSMMDPASGTSIDEGTIATDDRMPIWDESASSWKYVTIDNLQDEIDTTGGGGGGGALVGSGPANDRIAIWENSGDIGGQSNATIDSSGNAAFGGTITSSIAQVCDRVTSTQTMALTHGGLLTMSAGYASLDFFSPHLMRD